MAEETNINDLQDSGELSETEASGVAGGFAVPVLGGGTDTIIDTVYPNKPPTNDTKHGDK